VASGDSCTCVATEYGAAFSHQDGKFAAQVHYYDNEQIQNVVQEHVNAYLEFTFNPDPDWTEDDRQVARHKARTALKAFQALFCGKKEFKSEESAEKFLELNKDSASSLVSSMFGWAVNLLSHEHEDSKKDHYYREAKDTDEFHELIDPLLSPVPRNKEAALWPLVKYVSIGIKGSRVLENVTIADLPGINDTNQVKVNACLEHLRECDGLWIVAQIARASDNSNVNNMFWRFEERFRGKIAIVCTRIDDDIGPALARDLEEKKVPVKEYAKYLAQEKKARAQVSFFKAKIRSRMGALPSAKRAKKVKALKTDREKWEEKRDDLALRKWTALVTARNGYVTMRLQQEMALHLPEGGKLLVFCVSNAHYQILKGAETSATFVLRPEDTGVPALRDYALSLAAPGVMQAFEDYLRHRLTAYLKGLELWAISRYVEGGKELLGIVKQPHAVLGPALEYYQTSLHTLAVEAITEKLIERTPKHTRLAVEVFERKCKNQHWATNKAFMRKEGRHKTAVAPPESWNEQFSEPAIKVLNKKWGQVNTGQGGLNANVEKSLLGEVDEMMKALKVRPASEFLDMNSFEVMLLGQTKGIRNAFRDHQQRYAQETK